MTAHGVPDVIHASLMPWKKRAGAVSANSIKMDKPDNPRHDMIPGLTQRVTEDFRGSVVRERVQAKP